MNALRILVLVLAMGMIAPSFAHANEGTVSREVASKKKKKNKKAKKQKAAKKNKKEKRKNRLAKRGSHSPRHDAVPSSHDMAPAGASLPTQPQGDDLPKPSTDE